jgi:hypothetical protein
MPTDSRARLVAAAVLAATLVQLVVAAFVPDLPQFEGKGFGARLALYPAMMLVVPALWRWYGRGAAVPWTGFTLVMTPFLVDVTGNTLDLYDRVVWFDDACHFLNWFLLTLGLALVVRADLVRPAWARVLVLVGGGALLAVVWEVGEWFAFIRYGTELATAYQDTLGDEVLGTSGSLLAALTLTHARRLLDLPAGRPVPPRPASP